MFCVLYSHDSRIDNKSVLNGQKVLFLEIVIQEVVRTEKA